MDMAGMEILRTRFDELKETQDSKDKLIEELFREVKLLSSELLTTKNSLDRVQDISNRYWQDWKESDRMMKLKELEISRLAFVSVLIDGDCMNFNDNLVKQAENGGHAAAQLLKKEVIRYLDEAIPQRPGDIRIAIRIYANITGLARTYREIGAFPDTSTFDLFLRGFNMDDPLCEFIDAGIGKECSDEKLRENFKLHASDIHCTHIIFGGSADNGYARLLNPYVGDDATAKRITMLEGPPFAKELADLTSKFATCSFPAVFRSTKIGRKVSFSSTLPTGAPANYANTAAQGIIFPMERPSMPGSKMPASKVARNRKGQRVDRPIAASPQDVAYLKALQKGRKLCNQFHLLGRCNFGSNCCYPHVGHLSPKQLEALRYIARLAPCGSGLECDDENCISGHRCPRGPSCAIGDCKFPRAMHQVDTNIVE